MTASALPARAPDAKDAGQDRGRRLTALPCASRQTPAGDSALFPFSFWEKVAGVARRMREPRLRTQAFTPQPSFQSSDQARGDAEKGRAARRNFGIAACMA